MTQISGWVAIEVSGSHISLCSWEAFKNPAALSYPVAVNQKCGGQGTKHQYF